MSPGWIVSPSSGRGRDHGGPLTDRRTITLVARREMRDRLRQRSYLIGVAVTALFVVAGVVLPTLLGRDDAVSYRLTVVDDRAAATAAAVHDAAARFDREVVVEAGDDRAEAEAALSEGSTDAALVDRRELLSVEGVDDALVEVVEIARAQLSVADNLDAVGVSPDRAADVLRPPDAVAIVELGEPDPGEEPSDLDRALGMISAFLLFSAVTSTSNLILTGTMEEKTNKVVEVMLGTLRPRHLLAGKLVGLGILGLAQMVLLAAVGLGTGLALDRLDLPDIPLSLVGCAFLYFLGGFVLYSALYAVAGAMSSTTEDAQSAAAPIVIGLLAGWIVAAAVIPDDPDGPVAHAVSLFPFTSSVAMPARVAIGDVAPWELVLSLTILAATTWGTVRLGGRLYSSAILSGANVSWRRVLRLRST